MATFNVIIYDVNRKRMESYDIIPYLKICYDASKKKRAYRKTPKTFEEFKQFILAEAQYQWWARCEYEIILSDWPCQQDSEKWDVYKQVEMNIDVITEVFMKYIKETKRKKNHEE